MPSLNERILPELLLFKPGQERKRMLKQVRSTPRAMVAAVLFGLANFTLFVLTSDYIIALGLSKSMVTLLYLAYVLAALSVPTWFTRRAIRRELRVQLTQRGIPICIPCGYDLRGQTRPRCPECGTSFDAKLIDGSLD